MQISSRFTIAVHICACLHAFEGKHRLTSDFLASSVNVNPVIARKTCTFLVYDGTNCNLLYFKKPFGSKLEPSYPSKKQVFR